MGLSLEVDKFTPCLVKKSSSKIVNTNYSVANESELKYLNKKGWKFDWCGEDLNNSIIYKLCLENDSEIQGLIAVTDYPKENKDV